MYPARNRRTSSRCAPSGKVASGNLYVLSETCLGDVLECVSEEAPDILIVDSIQTLYNEELDSPAGSVSQVKDCTMTLMQLAKGQGITVFVIGHVNKEGSIAGPKVLEHMVDCVLYFEGDQHMTYRILRAAKNRFGATNEIGVFEMMDWGLKEVEKCCCRGVPRMHRGPASPALWREPARFWRRCRLSSLRPAPPIPGA